MQLQIYQLVQDHLPQKRKITSKGWINFNAPCCHHRGHNQDTRSRGNCLITGDGAIVANCYNCGFKARYLGGDITHNFENWLVYIGAPQEKIQEAKLEILSKKLSGKLETIESPELFKIENFHEVELPTGSRPLLAWMNDEISDDLASCLTYLGSRGRAVADNWEYHWTPSTKWNLNHRIIIPFYHRGTIVGWTARYAGTPPKNDVPRYFNGQLQEGYVFNSDVLSNKLRKFVILAEGPLDAISIDGVAALGSKLNKQQIQLLNSSNQEKIVIPDRQLKNQELIDVALEQGWYVSFPDWETNIKDAAAATCKYGRLYTLATILNSKTKSQLQIGYKRKLMKG